LSTEWEGEYFKLNDQFRKLQELHDEQKKIIARLQEENQQLKQENKQLKQKLNEYTKPQ
jgi:regulator of replication initiation timing